jgi:hypothetical protein
MLPEETALMKKCLKILHLFAFSFISSNSSLSSSKEIAYLAAAPSCSSFPPLLVL